MRYLIASLLCVFTLSLTAQETITYPYNPDEDVNGVIASPDLLGFLGLFGDEFSPAEIMIGDTTLSNWILILNQTLANQQAVIDSLQANLDSQDTQLDSTMIADMIAEAVGLGAGGGGNKYLALVQFNVSEDIASVSMVDPGGNGDFITSGITTSTSTGGNGQKFGEFSFSNEALAPSAIIIYAVDMNNSKYKITHLNSGGDNSSYELTGVSFNNTSGNNYDSNLFSAFGSATIKLDLTKSNIDYVRDSQPPQFKEAHAYILFQF